MIAKVHSRKHPFYDKYRTTCGRDTRRLSVTENENEVTCKWCKGGGIASVKKKYFDSKIENQLEYFKS